MLMRSTLPSAAASAAGPPLLVDPESTPAISTDELVRCRPVSTQQSAMCCLPVATSFGSVGESAVLRRPHKCSMTLIRM